MEPMTTQTPQGKRTFDAEIAVLHSFHGHRTVVSAPGDDTASSVLPLTDVTVTLRADEVFMATGGNGQTGYFTDLAPAVAFTRHTGAAGTPGAIVVLTPCITPDGITGFNISQVHEHSKADPHRSF